MALFCRNSNAFLLLELLISLAVFGITSIAVLGLCGKARACSARAQANICAGFNRAKSLILADAEHTELLLAGHLEGSFGMPTWSTAGKQQARFSIARTPVSTYTLCPATRKHDAPGIHTT